jgi:hypothetical protein
MKPTERIYRIEPKPDSASVWWIYGLNLLLYNRVAGVDSLLPFKAWLRCLLDERPVSVLIGGSAITSAGWPSVAESEPIRVETTFYAGQFYNGSENILPGIFYPRMASEFLVSEAVDRYLQYDALVILVGVHDTERVLGVLKSFSSEEQVREQLQALSEWVIVSQWDGYYLEVWSQHPQAELEIVRCCEAADTAVRELDWFRQVHLQLQWSDDQLCYVEGGGN